MTPFPMPHSIKRRLFICLGRFGDVINILPVVREYANATGTKPLVMIGAEFASLLDGVSYAEALIWRAPWQHCVEAEAAIRANRPDLDVVNCAVYGIGYHFKRQSANYQREAWRLSGTRTPWGRLPLVFDRRNLAREADQVTRRLASVDRPFVVTCFSGVSTPFHAGAEIIQAIRDTGHAVIDLSEVREPRIFDVLGLLERASALVVSDTSVLHLAAAVPSLPIISLVSDQAIRWQRSEWTPQHAARVWYSEATIDPTIVARAVNEAVLGVPRPKLVHVWCFAGAVDSETDRRMRIAREGWEGEYAATGRWETCPVPAEALARDSATVHGDPKPAPFYRDVLALAAAKCGPKDVIVLSNADVGPTPGITGWILDGVSRGGAVFTHRWDFDDRLERPVASEFEAAAGKWYPGSDCWAFTREWFDQHFPDYPDMMMGREAGDLVLRHLVKRGGGTEVPAAIWHEKHPSFWEHWGNRDTLPGNLQNRLLATEWLRDRFCSWDDGSEVRPGQS